MARKDFQQAYGERSAVNPPGESNEALKERVAWKQRRDIERQDELEEAEHNAKVKKAEREGKEAEAAIEKAENRGPGNGSGFQVKGEVNLGSINYAAMLEKADNDRKIAMQEQKAQMEALGTITEDLRERLHKSELDYLKATLGQQMEEMKRMIEQRNQNQVSLPDQIEAIKATAKSIGLHIAEAGGSGGGSIELAKLQMSHELELERLRGERELQNRQWNLDLRKYGDDVEERKEKIKSGERTMALLGSAFDQIGAAIARGMIEAEGRGVARKPAVQQEYPEEAPTQPAPLARQGDVSTGHHIEAAPGESGTVECPDCGETIYMGPTARHAVCPNCELTFPITRVKEA